jgi:UDP-galactopyranose mutase
MYNYLIVGSGLYGSVFAQIMNENGRRCFVIDRRSHAGGNIYMKEELYGAHIFHTAKENVWRYVNRLVRFNHFVEPYYPVNDEKNTKRLCDYQTLAANEPKALFGGRLGQYAYYDMDDTIEDAMSLAKNELYLNHG